MVQVRLRVNKGWLNSRERQPGDGGREGFGDTADRSNFYGGFGRALLCDGWETTRTNGRLCRDSMWRLRLHLERRRLGAERLRL